MGDVFDNSISGLLAFQQALNTSSHNIANVNTEGYSRQRTEFVAREPSAYGNGFIGNGVQVAGVTRVFEQTRQAAVQTSSSEYERLKTLAEYSGQIDNLLADQTAGLSPALQSFFDQVQGLANDPTSSAAREALSSESKNLVARLQFLNGQIEQIGADAEQQLQAQVGQINNFAGGIAKLNQAIVAAQARAGGQPPNDLLDQRDQLVLELSALVSTKTVAQENGSINVFVGNGQTLVSGFTANRLQIVPGRDDAAVPEIGLTDGTGTPVNITATLQGGSLGGLLDFRHENLDPTIDRLGLLATSIATAVNNQNHLGMQYADGPAGELGGDVFRVAQPEVIASAGTSGTLAPGLALIDPSSAGNLTGANYRLSYDGSQWRLTNLSTAATTPISSTPQIVDGLSIDVSKISGAVSGDSFLIRPTRAGAAAIAMAITDPSQIAAAGPVRVAEASDPAGVPQNKGTGQIGEVQVSSAASLPLSAPYTLRFDAANNRFLVNGSTSTTIAYDPALDSAGVVCSVPGLNGVQFTLSGKPANGDQFMIESNSNALGDNRNILALGKLADTGVLDGGKTSFEQAYGSLVSDVGMASERANTHRDAQESVLNQAKAAREAVSGVNLDEEAANLLKYQQAYQASAQAIAIADTLFNSLLAAVKG
ncbi:MAG TPA: flagellar hook-associated protein FlgK [Nitrococcus sp.]|nr:flagellar hook-associated protein FlgK [Nitrococcus sp.]